MGKREPFFSRRIDESPSTAGRSRPPSPTAFMPTPRCLIPARGCSAAWKYNLPDTLDGLYQLNLRPSDLFGNSPAAGMAVLDGRIDTAAPR